MDGDHVGQHAYVQVTIVSLAKFVACFAARAKLINIGPTKMVVSDLTYNYGRHNKLQLILI